MMKDLAEEAKKRIVVLAICVIGLSYLMSWKTSKDPQVVQRTNWRRKVDSPVVEDAIEHITRHLIAEWVSDLWYCKLTLDREGPEELVRIIIDVLAEISDRARHVNLIDLLTRDAVSLVCTHLEIFRFNQAKIEMPATAQLSVELLDCELRKVLASENKLHRALFSAEAENKVLSLLLDQNAVHSRGFHF